MESNSEVRNLSLEVLERNCRSRYVAAAAGAFHTVLVRSDGTAVGSSGSHIQIPRLPTGIRYIAVAANLEHTILLRSDGRVVSCRNHTVEFVECSTPSLPAGMMYTSIASGGHHAVLLRSDGQVVAFGHNGDGRCNIPPCPSGIWYTAVAAGLRHSLLLRSDGNAVAFGENKLPPGQRSFGGPCDVPVLPRGRVFCHLFDSDCPVSTVTTVKTRAVDHLLRTKRKDEAQEQDNPRPTSPLFAACLQSIPM